MSFSFSKINGNLLFKDFGGYERRNFSTFWCIQQADKKYNFNDFNEIKIDTNDNYDGVGHSYIKINYKNLVPDFVFHSWAEVGINDYELFVNEISDAGLHNYEINKIGWIGAMSNFRRNQMLQIGNNNKELFDFFEMNWIRTNNDNIMLNSTKYISTPDLVKRYSMLIDIEGAGPYSARLKTLLWSHRPLLIVDRPGKEYFFEFLKEWEHYIPVKRDLSDLIEKTKWCLDNYDNALQIAENAYQFSKVHLTRDACYHKWKDIITSTQL